MTLTAGSPVAQSTPRKAFARIPTVLPLPYLIQVQLDSFQWLVTQGLREVLDEVSPIEDFTGTRFTLEFGDFFFKEPKHTEEECREKEITYSRPLYVNTTLTIKDTGEIKEQPLFFGDLPWMTPKGTFIVNGAERVVVSQLVRSPGAYLTLEHDPISDTDLCYAKLIPYRGAWLEFETSSRGVLWVKVDRKRKMPVTTLLRALGFVDDEELLALFADVDPAQGQFQRYIRATLERDTLDTERAETLLEKQKKEEVTQEFRATWNSTWPNRPYDHQLALRLAAARLEFYRRLRPGEPDNLGNANALLDNLFFNPRRYDLGRVGRYKLLRRLGEELARVWPRLHQGEQPEPSALSRHGTLTREDLLALVRAIIRVNRKELPPDDIDHLGNRRVRAVGELVQNAFRIGLLRMERVVRERMSTITDAEQATPAALVNVRPVVAAIREFFGGSQLSQFMDQTNPLAELTHKRRLSALGPGGLSRERAGFEVRDVHHSHYGRICPIETPEGPNIGLLGSMATYARINDYGFLETPYRRVHHTLSSHDPDLVGRRLRQDLVAEDGTPLAYAGEVVTEGVARRLREMPPQEVRVQPFVTNRPEDVVYLPADEEENYIIGQANIPTDEKGQLLLERVEARRAGEPTDEAVENVDYMDVSPMQIVSVSASLIPFLEHDDANRALMGANMQRQAVPLVRPEAPLVSTGVEPAVARDSGQVLLSPVRGVVTRVTGDAIEVRGDDGSVHTFTLAKYLRSNQSTCINQRAIVYPGQRVEPGTPLADSSSTDQGELALGHNVLVAFMSWEGYNYEDAVIISQDLVRRDKFTSVHIEKYECEARETKLGPEEITADIPNVGKDALQNLDEEGIIRIGAEVGPGDILVGKITPKGETELTPEEKLLRAIFGEKARDVKDTSLRVPHGERGKVIGVRVLTRNGRDELPSGVRKLVRVWVAQTRKITEGDKVAGRHGNKGVISKVMPVEDMPFLPDGTPVEMILNPIGVPSRMNLGQVMETHLGWVARFFGFRAVSPVFDGARDVAIEDGLARIWFIQRSGALDQRDLDNPRVDWERVREWLAERGYDADRLFDENVLGEAREACLRLWLREEAGIDPTGMDYPAMLQEARRLNRERRMAPPILGKVVLRDGRTGEPFENPVTVGYIYMMKLIHLVEDKVHARSIGPYSLITQQPLGGKAQFGGQRFGEMEVWALEAYSAAHNLQEMLTVKSDDVIGRQKTYEAILKGEDITQPGVPESFQVLLKELQALGLSVELLHEPEEPPLAPAPGGDGADGAEQEGLPTL